LASPFPNAPRLAPWWIFQEAIFFLVFTSLRFPYPDSMSVPHTKAEDVPSFSLPGLGPLSLWFLETSPSLCPSPLPRTPTHCCRIKSTLTTIVFNVVLPIPNDRPAAGLRSFLHAFFFKPLTLEPASITHNDSGLLLKPMMFLFFCSFFNLAPYRFGVSLFPPFFPSPLFRY